MSKITIYAPVPTGSLSNEINAAFRSVANDLREDTGEIPTLLLAIWTDVLTRLELPLPQECQAYTDEPLALEIVR